MPSTVVDSASKGTSPFRLSMTSSSLLYTRPHTFRTRSKKHATSMAMLKVSASAALTTARAAHGLPAPSSLATLVLENTTNFPIYNNCQQLLLIHMQLVVSAFTDGHKELIKFSETLVVILQHENLWDIRVNTQILAAIMLIVVNLGVFW